MNDVPDKKLTKAQRELLSILDRRRHKCSSAYLPMNALIAHGYAERITPHRMFERNAIFAITDAGRAALSSLQKD